eukprot:90797-Alexandrium_andersonii.AAC.1
MLTATPLGCAQRALRCPCTHASEVTWFQRYEKVLKDAESTAGPPRSCTPKGRPAAAPNEGLRGSPMPA